MAKYKRPKLQKGEYYAFKHISPAVSAGSTNGHRLMPWPRQVIIKKVYLVDILENGRVSIMEDVMRWKSPSGYKPAMMAADKVPVKRQILRNVSQAHLIAPWDAWEAGPKEKRKGCMEMAGT